MFCCTSLPLLADHMLDIIDYADRRCIAYMRMALFRPLLLLIFTYITVANAANFTLTPELTNFVPPCAQACFISFLDLNFQSSVCTTEPGLDCLCSHNTTSGYTVGEGAVQCIISEQQVGNCKGNDAKGRLKSIMGNHADNCPSCCCDGCLFYV